MVTASFTYFHIFHSRISIDEIRSHCSIELETYKRYYNTIQLTIKIEVLLAANIQTLPIYVDYKKAYDIVWHKGLVVKLNRLGIILELLQLIVL
jgi:hypothetical protein